MKDAPTSTLRSQLDRGVRPGNLITSGELVRRLRHLGVTYRKLDYWCRTPATGQLAYQLEPGSGRSRLFTPEEVAGITALANTRLAVDNINARITSGEIYTAGVERHRRSTQSDRRCG